MKKKANPQVNGEGLKIEYLPVIDLVPYSNNSKLHPQVQIDQISESIDEFGFNDPIAVDGKTMTIVEGHGRLEAAKQMGLDTVPVIRLDHLSDVARRAYAIAHNKLTLNSDFDRDLLSADLKWIEQQENGVNVLCACGFDDKELADLLSVPADMTNIEHVDMLHEKYKKIRPYTKTHVLLSFHPSKFAEVKEHLDRILKISGVEYEQGSNG